MENKISRRSFVAASAALAAAAGLGVGVASPKIAKAQGGKLVVSLSSSPSKLDPIHYSGTYESQIIGQVTDRLIEYNDALDNFEPSLATEWNVSEDGITYVFQIRQGVKFQNGQYVQGRELTAEDVAWSLNRSHELSDNNRLTGAVHAVKEYISADQVRNGLDHRLIGCNQHAFFGIQVRMQKEKFGNAHFSRLQVWKWLRALPAPEKSAFHRPEPRPGRHIWQ